MRGISLAICSQEGMASIYFFPNQISFELVNRNERACRRYAIQQDKEKNEEGQPNLKAARQYTTQSIICCLLLRLVTVVRATGILVFTPFLPQALHGRCRALSLSCGTLPAPKLRVLYRDLAGTAPAIPPNPHVELLRAAVVPSARTGVRHGPDPVPNFEGQGRIPLPPTQKDLYLSGLCVM